jgi:hypothetical protein
LFYSSNISLSNLAVGGATLFLLVLSNVLRIRHLIVYSALEIGGVWLAFLKEKEKNASFFSFSSCTCGRKVILSLPGKTANERGSAYSLEINPYS